MLDGAVSSSSLPHAPASLLHAHEIQIPPQKDVYVENWCLCSPGWWDRVTEPIVPDVLEATLTFTRALYWSWSHVTINGVLALQSRNNGSLTIVFLKAVGVFDFRYVRVSIKKPETEAHVDIRMRSLHVMLTANLKGVLFTLLAACKSLSIVFFTRHIAKTCDKWQATLFLIVCPIL